MITIPINPVPKPRMVRSDRWKKRKCVTAYWQFKDDVRSHIQSLPEAFKVIFYIEMPASWSEKKKAKFDGKPHRSRPDIDNFLKALMDAIAKEDGFIHTVNVGKRWARLGRIEIEEITE